MYDEIHIKYFRRLAYFADKIISDKLQAEDIASEALIKLWQRFDNFDNEGAIKRFLYLVTKRACVDFIRHRKYVSVSKEGFTYISDLSEQGILYLMIEAEILAEITNGIESLPKAERKIFTLLYFQEMDAHKVAEKTGLSIQTIWNQRKIVINKLKRRLKLWR